jgi:hypothetical protein
MLKLETLKSFCEIKRINNKGFISILVRFLWGSIISKIWNWKIKTENF